MLDHLWSTSFCVIIYFPRYEVASKIVLNVTCHCKRFSAYLETTQPVECFLFWVQQLATMLPEYLSWTELLLCSLRKLCNVTCRGLPSTLPNDIAWQVKLINVTCIVLLPEKIVVENRSVWHQCDTSFRQHDTVKRKQRPNYKRLR